MIYGPLTPHDTHKQISEIYTNNSWDLSNLSFALPQEITNLILSINPSLNNNLTDYPYLFLTSNGNFLTKTTISLLHQECPQTSTPSFEWIWKLNTLNKIKHFL